jgi:serine/threonine protein kinase
MKIQVKGKTISLGRRDFLASGGEGSVYVKRGVAYKIYADPKRMIPVGKIQELSTLTDKYIIKPDQVIYSKKKPVGYTMRFVKDTYAFCQLFTKAFKDRHNLTPDMCLSLVKAMQKTVCHIHENDILVVDLNEMNFLSDRKFKNVFFIDVDSYQTSNYPATALMESVRDRHGPQGRFNEGTDWFSFAVVTFQLLIGIHPYKGKHPSVKGMDKRMEQNISVFRKGVRVPKSCLPFKVIPPSYKQWYEAVFEKGLREPPPRDDLSRAVAVPMKRVIAGSNKFEMKKLFECKWGIHQYARQMQSECLIGKGICFDRRHYFDIDPPFSVAFHGSTPIAAQIRNGKLVLTNVRMQKKVDCDIVAEKIMAYDGRLYAKSGENILEIQFFGAEAQPVVGQRLAGKVLPQATHLFHGVAIQNMLGTYYASTFPDEGKCVQQRLAFLDGYRIIEAKFERGVLMVIGTKKGKYDRFVFDVANEEIRIVKDVSNTGLNFTVRDNGICVCINEQEQVEVFHKNKINKLKIIDDPVIHGGMRLFTDGGRVLFADGDKLYSFKMR